MLFKLGPESEKSRRIRQVLHWKGRIERRTAGSLGVGENLTTILSAEQTSGGREFQLTESAMGFVRPGRRFEPLLERELDQPMRQLAIGLPGARSGVYVLPEFAGTVGVADLVAVTRAHSDIFAREQLDVPPITSLAVATVAATINVGRTTTAAHVSRVLQMSDRQVQTYLGQLTTTGAIRRVGVGYRRDPRLKPVGRLYALEAKVSDWAGGINQAVRYAGWADAAAVVVLRPPRRPEEMISYARRLHVGVAVGARWLVRPVLFSSSSPYQRGARLLASERFVTSVTGASD